MSADSSVQLKTESRKSRVVVIHACSQDMLVETAYLKNHAIIANRERLQVKRTYQRTAQTTVLNTDVNETEVVRLVMDSGSKRTYITEHLTKRLNLKKKATNEITLQTFGADKPKTLRSKNVSFKIRLKDGVCMLIDAYVVPKITRSILRRPLQMDVRENVKYLCNNLQLADTLPSCLENSTIEILIVNGYYLDIILPKKIDIQQGLYLLSSKLGWILTERSQLKCCLQSTIDTYLQIKPSIEDFWNLEIITIQHCPYTSDDENTLSNFFTSLRMENGRYHVAVPWKEKLPELPENRELPYGRLKTLFQKMKNNPDLLNKHDEIVQDQCKKGIIEKVSNQCSKETGIKHYIPHHAVVEPTKPKLKVPFVVISSPFLLVSTLDYHLDTYKKATAANIRENIYVDNVITGVDSTKNAITLY
ncbi:unnamed protein product [Mytilus edulis]|uniref:DUF1758 domain-containing protein n=1 Tax=Mytilus edulis TaxID=6550 RepID=A0A8S3QTR3_MYTED|nr:unnamed protein product [Mytilus edulis]